MRGLNLQCLTWLDHGDGIETWIEQRMNIGIRSVYPKQRTPLLSTTDQIPNSEFRGRPAPGFRRARSPVNAVRQGNAGRAQQGPLRSVKKGHPVLADA